MLANILGFTPHPHRGPLKKELKWIRERTSNASKCPLSSTRTHPSFDVNFAMKAI